MTRVIGLTGGIASGKSAVANLLQAKGAELIDADVLAREIVEPGQDAYNEIVAKFGDGVLQGDGTLDRAKLGQRVFGDPDARAWLNGATHPRIRALMGDRLEQAKELRIPVVVLVIPLLLENRLEHLVDEVWLVAASIDVQRARIMARDGLNEEEANRRIASQMALEDKIERSHRILYNEGSRTELQRLVDKTWLSAQLPAIS